MKPKPDFDPMFQAEPARWYWPIRSIGQLMIVVALSGLALCGRADPARRPDVAACGLARCPAVDRGSRARRPVQRRRRDAAARSVRDRRSPRRSTPTWSCRPARDLDEAMVFNPGTRAEARRRRDPAPGRRPPVPAVPARPRRCPDRRELIPADRAVDRLEPR